MGNYGYRWGALAAGALGLAALVGGGVGAAAAPAPAWRALVSTTGSIRLEHQGREFGALEPGLFEAVWRGATLGGARIGQASADGVRRGEIHAPGGTVVATEVTTQNVPNGLKLSYRLTPQAAVRLNSLHVNLTIPAQSLVGGHYVADGERGAFPAERGDTHMRSNPARSLQLVTRDGAGLRFEFAEPTPVLLQDDRQWGETFSVRIGPQMADDATWPAGKTLALAFTLTAVGGMGVEYDGPVTMEAGPEWVPLQAELEIEPGSALDFSKLIPWHAPAGSLGRLIAAPTGKLAFADRPNEPARFYGVNFCFTAQYLPHEQADRLAERLRRLGYNAVRLHHYESTLVDRAGGSSTRLKPEALDQLDYFFAALKRQGIYVTTDLFVSRPVFAREVWEGAEGDIPMDDYKMAVLVNERAFENLKTFATTLLGHTNPYTGTRYAEDPTLAWLSLVNEGNAGNFLGRLNGRLKEDWERAWARWLAQRPGGVPGVAAGTPFPGKIDNSPQGIAMGLFLAETERDFARRVHKFLREELHCAALITNDNAWTNPMQYQAVRGEFDYVDDHFYVDHPEFIERPWSLPSRCANTSPVASGAPGGRGNAFHRLFDRPFTISEFNYSGPGRFRGVGGILTGALGAVQDWSVIWRFAYSHSRDNLFNPSNAGYFDMATDPLSLASERASLCLFLRGDLSPAKHAVAIAMTPDDLLKAPKSTQNVPPAWNALAWVTRVGSVVSADPAQMGAADLTLPLGWATPANSFAKAAGIDPYAPDAGQKVMAELRKRGWVSAKNRTNLAASCYQSDNEQITIDAPADRLILDTPRTAGGYAHAGTKIETGAASISIEDTDATVWVSSLDSQPLASSRRMLITHLTDLQNSGARYADKARKVLLGWGQLPHLVRTGRATVTLRLKNAARARVWGLASSGKRLEPVPAKVVNGALVIPLAINASGKARMLYEVEVP